MQISNIHAVFFISLEENPTFCRENWGRTDEFSFRFETEDLEIIQCLLFRISGRYIVKKVINGTHA